MVGGGETAEIVSYWRFEIFANTNHEPLRILVGGGETAEIVSYWRFEISTNTNRESLRILADTDAGLMMQE